MVQWMSSQLVKSLSSHGPVDVQSLIQSLSTHLCSHGQLLVQGHLASIEEVKCHLALDPVNHWTLVKFKVPLVKSLMDSWTSVTLGASLLD